MDKINESIASNFSGFLEKKSPNFMGGWQKRFFKILEGKLLTYSEREVDINMKGALEIDLIKNIAKNGSNGFEFVYGDRIFYIRASNTELRDKWVEVLIFLKENLANKSRPTKTNSRTAWKVEQLGKESHEILKKSGLTKDKDLELSKKAIFLKFSRGLNIQLPEIQSRIYYGFLERKKKKLWFFIISPRPLSDRNYEIDDSILDDNKFPKNIAFDTLYYFQVDNENDDSPAKGHILMSECHEVAMENKDDRYIISIDVGEKKHEFISDFKGERDMWYEVLRNSRKTAKDMKNSITKKPRNLSKLLTIVDKEGIGKLRDFAEKEKEKIAGNYWEISEYEVLEFVLNNLENHFLRTIDGCILHSPPKSEIIKTYSDIFNSIYLLIIQKYWSSHYSDLESPQLIRLATLLFNYEEKLHSFGIADPNFENNGRELIKIFIKKTFHNMKTILESILRSEREVKAVSTSDNILITNGPYDLFKLIYSIFDIFKKENFKLKYIVEQFIILTKECVTQYLIGVDCVISRIDLDIDKEFLIAIANNSNKINSDYEELIDQIKIVKVLKEDEVDQVANQRDISRLLMMISTNSITRFVTEMSDAIEKEFGENFMSLEISNILEITFTTFCKFTRLMHHSIQRKTWGEIVKSLLFHYIKSLLTTAGKKIKKIEDLTKKIRNDKEEIFDAFKDVAGENLTKETLKILDDFLNFLDVSPDMISLSCSKIREFNGPQFTISTVKALINLRCDLNKEEKNEAINSCKFILDNFSNEENSLNKNNGLLSNLESEINQKEKQEREEESKEEILEGIEDSLQPKKRKTISLADFLNVDGFDEDDLDLTPEETEKNLKIVSLKTRQSINECLDKDDTKDTDIIHSGKMFKKSSATYQERFFQLKNGFLYWYKSEFSKESQNHIAIKDMKKIEEFKSCKFMILSTEKVYKFECKSEEEKAAWINALNSEIKRLRGESVKKIENIYEMKLKKKVIIDYYNLPNIYSEKLYMKKKVDQSIESENYFLPKSKKNKIKIEPNKKLIDQKVIAQAPSREKRESLNLTSKPSDNKTTVTISPLSVSLVSEKPKSSNKFTGCLDKFVYCFKKKNYTNYGDDKSITN